jgi:glucan 1,3-beta-glucosidase
MKSISAAILCIFVLRAASQLIETPEADDVAGNVSEESEGHEGDYSESSILKRQSTAYWYEVIDHQGISAFGPSGYQVYRNVMDYGATGEPQLPRALEQGMC